MGGVKLQPYNETENVAKPLQYCNHLLKRYSVNQKKNKKKQHKYTQCSKELWRTMVQLNRLNQYRALDTQRVKEIKSRDTNMGEKLQYSNKPNGQMITLYDYSVLLDR